MKKLLLCIFIVVLFASIKSEEFGTIEEIKSSQKKIIDTAKESVFKYNVKKQATDGWLMLVPIKVITITKEMGIILPAKQQTIFVFYKSGVGLCFEVGDKNLLVYDLKKTIQRLTKIYNLSRKIHGMNDPQHKTMYYPTISFKYDVDGKVTYHKGPGSLGVSHYSKNKTLIRIGGYSEDTENSLSVAINLIDLTTLLCVTDVDVDKQYKSELKKINKKIKEKK